MMSSLSRPAPARVSSLPFGTEETMARIRIDDLPLLQELTQEELQGIYGEGLFPGERLRQMAAAATLGITLASASIATAGGPNKGGQSGNASGSWGQSRAAPVHTQHNTPSSTYKQTGWQQSGWQGNWQKDSNYGGYQRSQHVTSFCKEHGVKFSY